MAAACSMNAASIVDGAPLDRVTLRLEWKHQFQFAGYYAALVQGYCREAGLDVVLREAEPGADPVEAMFAGEAEFGVGTSELLLAQKNPVIVLAAIFRHPPLVLLARARRWLYWTLAGLGVAAFGAAGWVLPLAIFNRRLRHEVAQRAAAEARLGRSERQFRELMEKRLVSGVDRGPGDRSRALRESSGGDHAGG